MSPRFVASCVLTLKVQGANPRVPHYSSRTPIIPSAEEPLAHRAQNRDQLEVHLYVGTFEVYVLAHLIYRG